MPERVIAVRLVGSGAGSVAAETQAASSAINKMNAETKAGAAASREASAAQGLLTKSTSTFKNEMAASGSVASATAKTTTGALSGIKGAFSDMGTGAKVGFTAAAVGAGLLITETLKGVAKFAELTGQVREFQRVSGTSAEDASKFSFAMQRLGIDTSTGATAVGRLEARMGSGKVNLEEWGVTVAKDSQGHTDMTKTLENVSDRFKSMPDATDRAAFGMALFGRGWQTLLPLLMQGHEELQKFFDLADKQGLVFNQQDLEAGKQYNRAIHDLKTAWEGLQVTLGREVIPELTGITNGLATATEATSNFAGGTNVFRDVIENVLPVSMPFYMAGHAVSSFVDLLHGDLAGAAEQSTRTIPLIGNAIADINPWFDHGGDTAKDWGQAVQDAAAKVKETKPHTDEHKQALKEFADAATHAGEQEHQLTQEETNAASSAAIAKLNQDAYASSLKDIAKNSGDAVNGLAGYESRVSASIEADSKAHDSQLAFIQAIASGDPVKIEAAANTAALAERERVLATEQEHGIDKGHAARDALLAYRDGLFQALAALPPNSEQAAYLRQKIAELNGEIDKLPPEKPIHISSNAEEQQYKVLLLQLTLAGLPNPSLTIKADGTPAIVTSDGTIFTINQKTGQVQIDGDPAQAAQKTQDVVNWINAQHASIKITAEDSQAVTQMKALAAISQGAQSGVTPSWGGPRWGGVFEASGFQTYAKGGMRRGVAQIAGSPVLWGEKQTDEELYLPKRGDALRNAQLLQVAAGWQGKRVVPMAAGGVIGGAFVTGATPASTGGAPAGTEALGAAWAAQLDAAAKTVGPNVAAALQQMVQQGVPIMTQFGDQTLASLTQHTQALTGTWQTGLGQMVTDSQSHLTLMNANTQQQYDVLKFSTGDTANQVVNTMTMGAAEAGSQFVAQLQQRIPPLQFTLAGYSGSVLDYGRDFLGKIGVPATFDQGGFWDPHIMRDGAYELRAGGGVTRVSGERGTGGEAYIPKHGAKDPGHVLSVAAGWHGYRVVPFESGGLSLEELFWEAGDGTDWKNGQNIGRSIGGHADHVHAGTTGAPWQSVQEFLNSNGVPAIPTSTTGGSHASGSLHYLGRAVDYGNVPNPNVSQIYHALLTLIGAGIGGYTLPDVNVPGIPDFGPGVLGNGMSPGMASSMANIMRFQMAAFLNARRQEALQRMMDTSGAGTSSGGSAEARAYAQSRLAAYGWGMDQWAPLDALWAKESGWNPDARNSSSGAAGIPQDISGNFHGGYQGQVDWGLNYIAGRYGSPAAAWQHEQRFNWYRRGGMVFDQGGVLPPGPSIVHNDTGRPERLIPAPANGAAAVNVHVHLGGLQVNGLVDSQSAQFDDQVHDLMEKAARGVGEAVKRAIA